MVSELSDTNIQPLWLMAALPMSFFVYLCVEMHVDTVGVFFFGGGAVFKQL